jgi:hypothetical protein
MADQRKITRAQAKLRIASERRTAEERAGVRYARVISLLGTTRTILEDSAFTDLVRSHGIQSLPRPLVTKDLSDHEAGNALIAREGHFSDCSLEFAVAWRFFAPLLSNPALAIHLDTRWPGFTLELRDVFILLIADGPFPYQPIGRGRRTILSASCKGGRDN